MSIDAPYITSSSAQAHALPLQSSKITTVEDPIMAGKNPYPGHPIHIHPARPLYRFAATGLGAAMWFWLFYRFRHDGPVLFGWKHPWDH